MAEIVADIANASAEQSTGIEEVNKALTQMDEVTQQNSALVEENAATAKTLETQANAMDERVGAFRLDESAMASHAARPAAVGRMPSAPTVKRPAPKVAAAPRRMAANGGPARRMQAALALAMLETISAMFLIDATISVSDVPARLTRSTPSLT